MSLRFDGAQFAHAWLAVASASATDKNAPWVLFKTVHVEVFPEGVRLIASDTRVLLKAWVPVLDDFFDGTEPGLDVMPERTVIASDDDGRGKSLLGYVLSLIARMEKEERDVPGAVEVFLDFDVRLPAGSSLAPTQDTLDGLEPTFVTLTVKDVEQVFLQVVPGTSPGWRELAFGHRPAKRDRVRFSPQVIEQLARAGKHASNSLEWIFGGEKKAALVDFVDSDPLVSGFVMPQTDREDAPDKTEPTSTVPAAAKDFVTSASKAGFDVSTDGNVVVLSQKTSKRNQPKKDQPEGDQS